MDISTSYPELFVTTQERYRKRGYQVFENVHTFNHQFSYIAVKENYKIEYEYVGKIDRKKALEFFYGGLFRELLYKDKKKECPDIQFTTGDIPCPLFSGDIYQDTLFTLKRLTEIHNPSKEPVRLLPVKTIIDAVNDSLPCHKIQGVAGSGKTYSMCYAAAEYASKHPDARILICVFNITLKNKIRYYLEKENPFRFCYNQIDIEHYHEIFSIKNAPQGKNDKVWKWKYKDFDKRPDFYDLILVDETQDLACRYCLENLYHMAKNKIIYLGDMEQDCYEYNEGAKQNTGNKKIIMAPGREKWEILREQYRSPNQIYQLASKLIKKDRNIFAKPFTQEYKITYVDKDLNQECLSSDQNMIRFIRTLLQHESKEQVSHTVILSYCMDFLGECYNNLIQDFSEITPSFDPEYAYNVKDWRHHKPYKEAFSSYDDCLKISTIHSFKGLEQENVILVIRAEDRASGNYFQRISRKYLNSIYTAMTRATKRLYVIDGSMYSSVSDGNFFKDFFAKNQDLYKNLIILQKHRDSI